MKLKDRIQHAWNAFTGTKSEVLFDYGSSSSMPGHKGVRSYNTSSYSAAIFNRIAMDVSMSTIRHVKMDTDGQNRTLIQSGLNNCLNIEANIDQSGIQFLQDIVYSMFDEGCVAVVPVDTTVSPKVSGSYEINSMRTGRITQWFPQHVRVQLYNEATGNPEEVTLPKANVAIIENPLYAVINGPNATLSRLLRKMAMLDGIDEMISAGKLDMIVQLPYAVKTELQKAQANERVKNLEAQLATNRHGIAYMDATEKITQLSRPINDKMAEEVKALSDEFYNQLGLTANVFNGTANEAEMRGYYTRTIDPILNNILAEFNRKFLTKTARSQGQRFESYRDPFSLVPIEDVAKIADTFRRNSILSSNEIRGIMGIKPHDDKRADDLFNPNIADNNQNAAPETGSRTPPDDKVKMSANPK